MARILSPKGLALIYAWAQEQERNSVPSTYLKQQKSESIDSKKSENIEEKEFENQSGENTDLKKSIEFPLVLPIHKNRTNFEHSDLLVPWKTKEANALTFENVDSKTFLRYYHVFKERELEDLIRESHNLSSILTIKESYYDQGNWCVILVKNNH
jgi:alkylated DNA repair protein alkB family protein 8